MDESAERLPSNLYECLKLLEDILPSSQLKAYKETDRDSLIQYHFTLGLMIRNRWLYPGDAPLKAAFEDAGVFVHPDEISTALIEAVWVILNEGDLSPTNLEEILRKYYIRTKTEEGLERLCYKLLGG